MTRDYQVPKFIEDLRTIESFVNEIIDKHLHDEAVRIDKEIMETLKDEA
jgi:ribosomal protein L31E